MATSFKPQIARGYDSPNVNHYTPDATATFTANEFVYWDTSNDWMEVCGADPALIVGLSVGGASGTGGTQTLSKQSRIPIYVLTPNTILAMSSSTTPADSMIGNEYGITATSGVWKVDTAKTGADARVTVVDVDVTNGIFYVSVLSEFLQFDGIVS